MRLPQKCLHCQLNVTATFILLARGTLASALLFSAGWKALHREAFRSAFRSSVPRLLERFDGAALAAVATAEVLAAAAVVAEWPSARAAGLSSIGLLIVLTVSLFVNRDLDEKGCGCWTSAAVGKHARIAFVIRNVTLMVAGAVGVISASPQAGQRAFAAAVGALLAFVIMEIPTVTTVVLDWQSRAPA